MKKEELYKKLKKKFREKIVCPICGLQLDKCNKRFNDEHKKFH